MSAPNAEDTRSTTTIDTALKFGGIGVVLMGVLLIAFVSNALGNVSITSDIEFRGVFLSIGVQLLGLSLVAAAAQKWTWAKTLSAGAGLLALLLILRTGLISLQPAYWPELRIIVLSIAVLLGVAVRRRGKHRMFAALAVALALAAETAFFALAPWLRSEALYSLPGFELTLSTLLLICAVSACAYLMSAELRDRARLPRWLPWAAGWYLFAATVLASTAVLFALSDDPIARFPMSRWIFAGFNFSGVVFALLLGMAIHLAMLTRARKRAMREVYVELQNKRARLSDLMASLTVGAIVTDRFGNVETANRAACVLMGISEADASKHTIRSLLQPYRDKGIVFQRLREFRLDDLVGPKHELTLDKTMRDERPVQHLEFVLSRFSDGTAIRYTWVIQDATEIRMAQARLTHEAFHDRLTGLPNLQLLLDRTTMCLARRPAADVLGCAVMFIDIDRFKPINDTYGHAVGDEVLKMVSARMRDTIRPEDTVARVGGDEFVILLERVRHQGEVEVVAERLLDTLGQPFTLASTSHHIGASIGIVLQDPLADSAERMVKHADVAMYEAKQTGRNCYRMFNDSMQTAKQEESVIERDLRVALEKDQLSVHFQPIVCAETRELRWFEALMRWERKPGEFTSPAEFIPVAEKAGLIHQLGRVTIEAACIQVARWRDEFGTIMPVAVNISALELRGKGVLQQLVSALAKYDLPMSAIKVEITERVFVGDGADEIECLRELAESGISIAIDDFGTGYSSLAYISRMPVSCIKIDKSFLTGIPGDRRNTAISCAVLAIARSLNMDVVAEGVETLEQAEFLRQQGCKFLQGYLYAKPMEPSSITDLMLGEKAIAETPTEKPQPAPVPTPKSAELNGRQVEWLQDAPPTGDELAWNYVSPIRMKMPFALSMGASN